MRPVDNNNTPHTMDNPVSAATSGIKSAFSLRTFFQLLALLFIFYLVMGLGLRFLPSVFAPIYRLITNPLSYLPAGSSQS